ncbi:MAG TPA: low affinity iron permease family protein [Candidatus Methylomirabilis sp.]|nr:low affinity iron permease family protein [Candidatus Methylomirabilis sp.]
MISSDSRVPRWGDGNRARVCPDIPTEESTSSRLGLALERLAMLVTGWTATSAAFAVAVGTVAIWAATGPWFHFSDTWQLIINTGTTVVTFLMVFLIQRSQSKDCRAIHLKLNEIVAVLEGASNRLINVEDLTEADVRTLHERYQDLRTLAQQDPGTTRSHSIEEAEPGGETTR